MKEPSVNNLKSDDHIAKLEGDDGHEESEGSKDEARTQGQSRSDGEVSGQWKAGGVQNLQSFWLNVDWITRLELYRLWR